MKFIKTILLVSLFAICFANFDFTAREDMENNRVVGVVLHKETAVIRLYESGPYVTPYSRAQMVAYRLNEYLEEYGDIKKMKFSYPDDIYTASIQNKKLVSVYKDEIKYNDSTVEGLMSKWVNNLKVVMMPQEMKNKPQVPETKGNKLVEKVEENNEKILVADDSEAKKDNIAKTVAEGIITPVASDMIVEDIEQRLEKVEAKAMNFKSKKNGLLWFFTFLNLGLGVFLFFNYVKARKQLGNYEEIENTGRLEELENSVSMLLKELKDVSSEVADKTVSAAQDMASIPKETPKEVPEEVPVSDEAIVPEVEEKESPEEIEEVADILEEALEEEESVIEEEDLKNLEQEAVEEKPAEKPKVEEVAVKEEKKPDAQKLAEELDGKAGESEEENVINNPETNLSGLGMADLFKILSKLDKDLREKVQTILNNKILNKNERIINMNNLDMETELIAKVLGSGIEEVNLVIQLNSLDKGEEDSSE